MRRGSSVLRFVAAGLLTLLVAAPVAASRVSDDHIDVLHMSPPRSSPHHLERTTAETLWIFDADFEDLTGDNAGWTTCDRSGTPAWVNYWHKDTIRINGFEHLGDSTWWCGTYSNCWRQPRGYGNNWTCDLVRSLPEVASLTEPGDQLLLSYDQRYALEKYYDYGYTDVSTDGGVSWTTIVAIDNPGFGGPGVSQDWDSIHPEGPGHMELDLSAYAGQAIDIRFRVESDGAYSSEDAYDTHPHHACLDGAWQLDNIRLWAVAAGTTTIFFDDCESPGDNGWVHDDVPASGQTGVVFGRGLLGVDFDTGVFACDAGVGWMYAAVDPTSGAVVDGQHSWLMSPPINIEGVTDIVGQWHMWVDLPEASHDIYNLYLAAVDLEECISMETRFVDEHPGWWSGGPHWVTVTDNWTPFAGRNWLGVLWAVRNSEPPDGGEHGTGIFLNRQRVGTPVGGPGDSWEFHYACGSRFHDWFKDDLAEALADSASVVVVDRDDVVSVTLLASADGGATWQSYACNTYMSIHPRWMVPSPAGQIAEGAEVLYYFEAVDSLGQVGTFPENAPDDCFEFSILPITGSVTSPGILLVDKHCSQVPGEDRSWGHASLDYYREALDVLGYAYDVYEVESPGTSCDEASGPDTSGMKYYDTQIWITGSLQSATLTAEDQLHLVSWLSEASGDNERNLFVAGDNIGKELVGDGSDTLSFYTTWLAAEFLSDSVGEVTTDSIPQLRDAAGGFMTFDDRECVLRGGCPELGHFDVVQPYPGAAGTELVAEYVRIDMTVLPAGVVHTDTIYGYQTVTLGFGIESMVDVPLPNGHYTSGAADRVDLMSNVMNYFGKSSAGPGTGIPGNDRPVDRLEHAYPNPFNPSTTIEFSIATRGRVTARVYDLAGRALRTLVDEVLESGPHRTSWDGRSDGGGSAASGVYFIMVEAPGFRATRKLVLLK